MCGLTIFVYAAVAAVRRKSVRAVNYHNISDALLPLNFLLRNIKIWVGSLKFNKYFVDKMFV